MWEKVAVAVAVAVAGLQVVAAVASAACVGVDDPDACCSSLSRCPFPCRCTRDLARLLPLLLFSELAISVDMVDLVEGSGKRTLSIF